MHVSHEIFSVVSEATFALGNISSSSREPRQGWLHKFPALKHNLFSLSIPVSGRQAQVKNPNLLVRARDAPWHRQSPVSWNV